MVASVMTLMAIAGDRFFAIIFPLRARVTERRVGVVVTLVWLSALAIGLPPLFFYTYTERQWKDYLETFCTDVWPVTTTGCTTLSFHQRLCFRVCASCCGHKTNVGRPSAENQSFQTLFLHA